MGCGLRPRPKKGEIWTICKYWRQDTQWCAKPEEDRCTHSGPCNGKQTEDQVGLFEEEEGFFVEEG